MVLGRGGAMFGGQGQLGAFAAQVEIGVAPAVQFAGTAQGLAGAAGVGVFAGVMNQQDGQLELALQFPQVREQRGDLGGVVFIDPMQPDQRIQDQQDGPLLLDGVGKALAIGGGIQPERGRGNDLHRQGGKRDLRGSGNAFQALAHHGQRVFGRKEQHRAAAPHRELPQAGGAGSDADRHIQGQEAFAAFGFAAQDADGLIGPESFDQPLGLRASCTRVGWPVGREAGSWLFGGLGIQGKDFEVEFFVDLLAFLVTGGGQQIVGHIHEQAQVAGGVFAERLDQRGAQELGVAGGFEQVVEAFLQLLGRQSFQAQAAADAAGDGQQLGLFQPGGQALVAGQDDGQDGAGVQVGTGQQAQFGQDQASSSPGLRR